MLQRTNTNLIWVLYDFGLGKLCNIKKNNYNKTPQNIFHLSYWNQIDLVQPGAQGGFCEPQVPYGI